MLYRNRYIIAIYDKDDFPIGVFDSVAEVCERLKCKRQRVYDALYRKKWSLYLIDVFSVEKDEFSETDMSLLALYQKGLLTDRPVKEIAQEIGCSERTVYRKKEVLK